MSEDDIVAFIIGLIMSGQFNNLIKGADVLIMNRGGSDE